MSVEEALNLRKSVRDYSGEALTEDEIAQLLWAAQGITHGERLRTAPSAGALYPLEVYVVTAEGLNHYDPAAHAIELLSSEDLRHEIYLAGLSQHALIDPPAVFVISGFVERTVEEYADKAARFMHIEAGHAAQNILLQAVALGLGAVPVGAFNDAQVRSALGLASDEDPLYLIPVGNPAP
jgi:SagB-type dehydrogenase family enzyme